AIAIGRDVLSRQPSAPDDVRTLLTLLASVYGNTCDWMGLRDTDARIRDWIAHGDSISPGIMARSIDDPALLFQCARLWAGQFANRSARTGKLARPHTGKLRIGYISPDFRQHVTGLGIVEIFEKHDRSRCDLFGFAVTPDDGSAVRKRIAGAFGQFHDVSGL